MVRKSAEVVEVFSGSVPAAAIGTHIPIRRMPIIQKQDHAWDCPHQTPSPIPGDAILRAVLVTHFRDSGFGKKGSRSSEIIRGVELADGAPADRGLQPFQPGQIECSGQDPWQPAVPPPLPSRTRSRRYAVPAAVPSVVPS